MTTPRDTEPLAPRRSLSKAQPPADGESVPPTSDSSALKPPPIDTNASAPRPAVSTNGRADGYTPPARPTEPPREGEMSDNEELSEETAAMPVIDADDDAPDEGGTAEPEPSDVDLVKAAPDEGEDPMSDDDRSDLSVQALVPPAVAMAAPFTAPSTFPAYTPSTQRVAPGDVETQAGLPVPPLPEPTAPAEVDKKAERAALKAQRKLEQSKPRTIRRAKLRVVRVDPWSVTKAAFLLSIAFGIMCVVAVFLVFSIMSASGLWDSVNTTIQGVVDQRPDEAFDINDYVGMSRVMGITMLISAIDVVIITALATLGAFIYNMAASLLGGVEVTLAEDLN